MQRSQADKQGGEGNMTTWQTSRKKTRIRGGGSNGDTRIRLKEQEEREDALARTQSLPNGSETITETSDDIDLTTLS